MSWLRVRFNTDADDCRPIYEGKTPEGPWWISGSNDEGTVIIAFVKSEATLFKQWPEASDVDSQEVHEISFSQRFPKPDWWDQKEGG
jgi:hypothetical protein